MYFFVVFARDVGFVRNSGASAIAGCPNSGVSVLAECP